MPYAQIAELLRQKYNLAIQRVAIFKFIKVRSRGRKIYGYFRSAPPKRAESAPAPRLTAPVPRVTVPAPRPPALAERCATAVKFHFTPSERYNLTRLSPEEAAAIRKKLEEEGH